MSTTHCHCWTFTLKQQLSNGTVCLCFYWTVKASFLVSGEIKQYFLYGSISIGMQLCIVFDHVASPHRYQQDRKFEARSVGISAMISPCLGFRLDLDKCIDTTTRLSSVRSVSKICQVNLHLFCKVDTRRTVDSLYILYRVSLQF